MARRRDPPGGYSEILRTGSKRVFMGPSAPTLRLNHIYPKSIGITLCQLPFQSATMHLLLTSILISLASAHAWRGHNDTSTRAIYTLSNDPSGNKILSLAVSVADGTISSPVLTSTGGKGLLGLNVGPPFGAPGSPAGPDGLFGSGSVVVSQNVSDSSEPKSIHHCADVDFMCSISSQ